ncbi:CdaR family protein [Aestuariivivens marinum]|uniref:CdaR family protein n=1 Tax=Aestuariivivens marinum TaxID=2913555 RepID=UPI001F5A8024|nr:YbbR-like domain-containing protein [Aestuariivivens marinum]
MIRKVKSKLLRSIQNKQLNVFLLFLFLAFVILIFSKLSKSYTNTMEFRIEKINVPEEKVILDNSDSILNITIKAYGFKWLDFYFSRPKIRVDFSKDVFEGSSKFVWTKSNSRRLSINTFAKNVEIIDIFPDTLEFNYDVNLVKKIPVEINTNITFIPGFDIFNGFSITPDSVKVIGPKDVVGAIDYIETETLVLEDVKKNIDKTIKLKLPKNGNIRFSDQSIHLKARVERFTEGSLKIPISIINVPTDLRIKYFPKEVTVMFYTSLEHFKSVKPSDFKVVCDYGKIGKEQSFFVPELVETSQFVKSVKINNQHIEFIILK